MIHRRRTAICSAVNEKPGANQDRLRKGIRRAVQRQGRPDAGLARSKGEFKNRRKSRSRRRSEAELFLEPKSASSRRRLPFLNTTWGLVPPTSFLPCLMVCLSFYCDCNRLVL